MKVLVVGILKYDITNEQTGQVISGTNLNYISPEVYYENMSGCIGLSPAKCKLDDKLISKYNLEKQQYPFTADLDFTTKVTPKGKSVAVLVDIKNIKKSELFS